MHHLVSLRQSVTRLWAKGSGKTLIAIAFGWGILTGTRMIYPVLLPYFTDEFNLTLTTAGLLITILWLVFAIGQIPGGILVDRYGERKIMTIGVLLVIIGLILVTFSPTAPVLFTATAVIGLGTSQYPVARITVLSELYPDHIGQALGLTMASGDIGQTVIPPVASICAMIFAWQYGLWFVIPLLFITALVIWLAVPKQISTDDSTDEKSNIDFRYVISRLYNLPVISTATILFLYLFVYQTFSAFYPMYLAENKGLSSTMAAILFGLFFAVGVVVKPISGIGYDKFGLRKSLPVIFGISFVGLVLLPLVQNLLSLVVITILISTMLGSGAVTQSFLADKIPEDVQGTGLGLIRSGSAIFGASGPILFGIIGDHGYFDEGYILLAIIIGIVTSVTFVMRGQ